VVIPDAELSWRFSRSSGPGGQHVNTSDSAAELSFDVARSAVLPQTYKDRALQRLAGRLVNGVVTMLAEATAPPPKARRPTKPSRRVQARRIEGKRRRGQIKRGRSGGFDD
jgi:ribosome-associated protein